MASIESSQWIRGSLLAAEQPLDPHHPYALMRNDVLDDQSAGAIEVHALERVVNAAHTNLGKARVQWQLYNPHTSAARIRDKQQAVAELRADDGLRERVSTWLEQVHKHESAAQDLVSGGLFSSVMSRAHELKSLRKLLSTIPNIATEKAQSAYLAELFTAAAAFSQTGAYSLANRFMFTQKGKLTAAKELSLRNLSLRTGAYLSHAGRSMLTGMPLLMSPIIIGSLAYHNGLISTDTYMSTGFLMFGVIPVILYAIPTDNDRLFVQPFARRVRSDRDAQGALETVAKLDELVTYAEFGERNPGYALPTIIDAPSHTFSATGLVNPVQAATNPQYVSTDVDLTGDQRLTFLTGVNSGGKTSLAKAVAQAQILGQAGCYAPAAAATISVADRIHFRVGLADSLSDEEGGYGTELQASRASVFDSTRHSLVLFSDLMNGTDVTEDLPIKRAIISGLLHQGATVMYITHDRSLLEPFTDARVGNYRQMAFAEGNPTYQFREGIAWESHALSVAKRVGMHPEDIEAHLRTSGALGPGESLLDISKFARRD